MAADGVVVSFSLPNYRENGMSCSGVVVDANQGLVLTSGVLLDAFLDNADADKLQNLLEKSPVHSHDDNDDLVQFLNEIGNLNVILPSSLPDLPYNLSSGLSSGVSSSKKSTKCELSAKDWRFFAVWKCEKLNDTFEKIFPASNGWNFDNNNCDENDERNVNYQEQKLSRDLLSYFILIRSKSVNNNNFKNKPNSGNSSSPFIKLLEIYKNCPEIFIGDVVRIVSTPFANLSPSVFLNSVTQGIISNVSDGKDGVLIMTDARSVPGCEGGALYTKGPSGEFRDLVGVIVLPFCWRQNEWVGLSFACSIKHIIESLVNYSKKWSNYPIKRIITSPKALNWESTLKSIVIIKSGLTWGSGIVLDCSSRSNNVLRKDQKLVLTCSHVIQGRQHGKVKVRPYGHQILNADILFAGPKDGVFDVAILRLDLPKNEDISGLRLENLNPVQGDEVVCVGYALFDDAHQMWPLMTRGLVSKIISHRNDAVMLQASCAIHPGASGGALVSTASGKVCGIVVCNTKDENSGASYPHISICIPSTVIVNSIQEYLSTGCLDAFKCIHNADGKIQDLWTLRQYKHSVGDLSKL